MKTNNCQPGPPYTVPVICSTNPKDWFIYFEFFHAGKWHSLKKREGINRIHSLKERKFHADQLRQAREEWLKMGWNPITDPKFKVRNILHFQVQEEMCFVDALDFALSKKKVKPKSLLGYKTQVKYIKEAAISTGHSLLKISQVNRAMCWDILDKVKELRIMDEGKFTNHAYNKYGGTLRGLFTELIDHSKHGKIECNAKILCPV